MPFRFSDEELKRRREIGAELYRLHRNGRSIIGLARELGVYEAWVSKRINLVKTKASDRNRKHHERPMRHDFFSCIDTEEKAYWAGFLHADGCIVSQKSCVSLHIKEADVCHLKKFKRAIRNKHNKICRSRNNASFPNGYHYRTWKVSFSIRSQLMHQDLQRLGIVPRKSLTARPPRKDQIPPLLWRHFWRGVIDGDGTLGCTTRTGKKRHPFASLCGTKWTVEAFAKFVRDSIGGPKKGIQVRPNGLCIVHYNGAGVCRLICRLLYENSAVSLTRKRKIATAITKKAPHFANYSQMTTQFGYYDPFVRS